MRSSWQQALQSGFDNPLALLRYLGHSEESASIVAHTPFAMKVPQGFADKMARADLNCPLLKQVLPVKQEEVIDGEFIADPLQEHRYNPVKGVLHKYHGRVLITLTGTCAINCRYCFRRHFPYQANQISRTHWQSIIEYLQSDQTIGEVIFSGGDPLLMNNKQFAYYVESLAALPQLHTLRLHTRIPVVLPERIDEPLLEIFHRCPLNKVIVIHANHANELCAMTARAFLALKKVGVHLLNQSVLLKGVNDNAEILSKLSHCLFEQGVLPYYLHCLDKVKGAGHFDLPLADIIRHYQQLQARLPGYLVPRLVKEVAGEKHKTLVNPEGCYG